MLLVPTLVATVYGANTWLPGERQSWGFASMLVLMVVTAVFTWLAISSWQKREPGTSSRKSPTAVNLAEQRVAPPERDPRAPRDLTVNPAVTIYEYLATDPGSRTPEMLRVFSTNEFLTPTEIGNGLAHTNDGSPLTASQARAILRNLSRAQGNLVRAGRLQREVLVKDFTGYDAEGAGRYGLAPEDRDALRAHLDDRRP